MNYFFTERKEQNRFNLPYGTCPPHPASEITEQRLVFMITELYPAKTNTFWFSSFLFQALFFAGTKKIQKTSANRYSARFLGAKMLTVPQTIPHVWLCKWKIWVAYTTKWCSLKYILYSFSNVFSGRHIHKRRVSYGEKETTFYLTGLLLYTCYSRTELIKCQVWKKIVAWLFRMRSFNSNFLVSFLRLSLKHCCLNFH